MHYFTVTETHNKTIFPAITIYSSIITGRPRLLQTIYNLGASWQKVFVLKVRSLSSGKEKVFRLQDHKWSWSFVTEDIRATSYHGLLLRRYVRVNKITSYLGVSLRVYVQVTRTQVIMKPGWERVFVPLNNNEIQIQLLDRKCSCCCCSCNSDLGTCQKEGIRAISI